jgi:hypothetical protein
MSLELLALIFALLGLVLLDFAAVRFGVDSRVSRSLDPAQAPRRNI